MEFRGTPEPEPEPAASHEMVCEGETGAEVLFVCTDDQCGRRVVVGKSRPQLTVIDRGDFSARHTGSRGGAFIDTPPTSRRAATADD